MFPLHCEGESHTSGTLIHRGPDGRSECGVWICTPGSWECNVTSDEFCHFIEGQATYTHESGEEIHVGPGTAAFFPKGWNGTCVVSETLRKVYMVR